MLQIDNLSSTVEILDIQVMAKSFKQIKLTNEKKRKENTKN